MECFTSTLQLILRQQKYCHFKLINLIYEDNLIARQQLSSENEKHKIEL